MGTTTFIALTNLETGEQLNLNISGVSSSEFAEEIFKLPFVDGKLDEDGEVRLHGKRRFANVGIHIFGS